MNQILDINWKKSQDKFLQTVKILEDGEVKRIPLERKSLRWKLSEERFCIGYYEDGKYYKCINSATLAKGFERCKYCEDKQGFRAAFLFGNKPNENARKYLSQKHFIYLAYFEPDIIKVGTASKSREELRPLEQDALVYAYIAENDGFRIQNLEKAISSNFEITEKVTLKQKLKSVTEKPRKNAGKLIRDAVKQIKAKPEIIEKYASWFLDDIKLTNLVDKVEGLYFPRNPNFENETEYVVGKVLGIRGRFLIIENRDTEIMLDKKQLIGRRIQHEDIDFEYSTKDEPTQIGMF